MYSLQFSVVAKRRIDGGSGGGGGALFMALLLCAPFETSEKHGNQTHNFIAISSAILFIEIQ